MQLRNVLLKKSHDIPNNIGALCLGGTMNVRNLFVLERLHLKNVTLLIDSLIMCNIKNAKHQLEGTSGKRRWRIFAILLKASILTQTYPMFGTSANYSKRNRPILVLINATLLIVLAR